LQADGFVPVAVIVAAMDCAVFTKLKAPIIRTKIETLAVNRFFTFAFYFSPEFGTNYEKSSPR
jgi:hypothetical protein